MFSTALRHTARRNQNLTRFRQQAPEQVLIYYMQNQEKRYKKRSNQLGRWCTN